MSGLGDDAIDATVVTGGTISNRKGVNLPGTVLDLSPLTEKDRADLEFGLELGVDWVALSFVQRPEDVIEARGLIKDRAGVMAKIEKPAALAQIDDIIRLVDALMVARGDLGVEIPHEEVPGRQKELVRACRLAAKPVIVATQMLEFDGRARRRRPAPRRPTSRPRSTTAPTPSCCRPSRRSGQYPLEAVAMMDRIICSHRAAQALSLADRGRLPGRRGLRRRTRSRRRRPASPRAIGAKAIVGFTSSGTTVARISRKRPSLPILAITPDLQVARRMALMWGAHSVHSEDIHSYEEMVKIAEATVRSEDFARPGDLVVVVAGIPFGQSGSTNNLRVIRIGG